MGVKIKSSEVVALVALGMGALFTAGAYYFFPGLHWGVAIGIFLVVMGTAYPTLLEIVAHEKIIDRGDWPTKKP